MSVAVAEFNVPAEQRDKHNELVAKARELAPILRERWGKTESERRVPDETIADFQEAGFFRILQPKRWGGLEMDPQTFFAVQIEIGAACPSSAWVLGVVGVHAWQLALFDERAQNEVWGEDTSTLVSSSYMPVGKVERVDGGFTLSGKWGFSSGSDHCDWVFVGAFVPPEGDSKTPDMRTFLVPRSDYEIIDDWYVSGLKGTGSKSISVDKAFVPDYRTHRFADGFKQKSPGHAINEGPLYKLPFGQIFVRSVSTSSLGMAKGALEAFVEVQAGRIARGDGRRVASDPRTQTATARAAATIDSCRQTLFRNFDVLMDYCRRDEPIPIDLRVQYRYDSSLLAESCLGVVDELFTASGGSAIFLSNPINKFYNDIRASRAHYANNPDKPASNWGSVKLGLKNTDYFI